ncbi:UNVERIFIED_CONTAM: hypothetical protein GTU68_048051 [Idotea baltica]|nr:hypothetical protein [Idotea baltica]
MVRGLLAHGDYNVIVVDWSGGSFALYSQATANSRVVGLETARMLDWTRTHLGLDISTVHIVGHSLGAHTAGYVGEKLEGLGRITGLDPAEPFFQYMPDLVRLDPSDAFFVDVIHTDIDSFFGLTGPRGFGLQQAVGHIDFYPNGGKDQPGCNQLLARVPMTLMLEGEDLIEGINAAQTELINCDHVRSAKLFTDSLNSNCPYLGFACPSYKMYKEGKCFTCGDSGNNCAFMGINADLWTPRNQTNVKVFLDTHYSPNFCKYHYILTINFADPEHATGTLRGRMKISLINDDGNLMKFDLTALSPLKFPRRGERTFLLEHYEDISTSQEALINWTFESDLLDPMTFCVIFCKADITISSISILSVDTPLAASRVMQMRSQRVPGLRDQIIHGGEIMMCHKKGESVVSIPSESTVKISASPSCKVIQRRSELHAQQQAEDSFSNKVYKAAASYYNG